MITVERSAMQISLTIQSDNWTPNFRIKTKPDVDRYDPMKPRKQAKRKMLSMAAVQSTAAQAAPNDQFRGHGGLHGS